ncbi:MAG: GNAT family N-acetyltransferase [Bdellovibrionales bacterium]|nr:GNAT family N-acetyltransferase [Bdellovibrionales bacterium]
MEIRPVTLTEIPLLCDLCRRTFHETFSPTNTELNMRVYMDTYFTPQKLEGELKDPKRSIFMAWVENQPVGYFNMYDGPVEACVKSERPIELARIYVDRAWQGKGVAQALMSKALEVARSKNKNGVWLGVWENNPRAQAFYLKNNFNKVGSHIFQMGLEPQTDYIYELSLV